MGGVVVVVAVVVSGKKRGVFVSFGTGKLHVSNHVIVYHICIATFFLRGRYSPQTTFYSSMVAVFSLSLNFQ